MFRTAVRQRRRSSCTDSDDGDADRGHDRGDHLHHRPTVDREKPISKTTTTTVKSTRDYTGDDDHRDGSKKKTENKYRTRKTKTKKNSHSGSAENERRAHHTQYCCCVYYGPSTCARACACVCVYVCVCVGCVYYRLRCARARHYVCVVCTRECVGA